MLTANIENLLPEMLKHYIKSGQTENQMEDF